MGNMSKALLERIIHHIFLPPELPQHEDEDSENQLPRIVLSALEALGSVLNTDRGYLDNAIAVVRGICAIHQDQTIDKVQLRNHLVQLPVGQTLAMKVSAQNAAVLVTRYSEHCVFECFELSPRNESAMKTKGRLVRTFPTEGVSIATTKLEDRDFIEAFTSAIAKMSHQAVPEFEPKSFKSHVAHVEDRDTTDPAVVSGLLFGLLSGLGSEASTTAITKRTREDILWNNARQPWRRSPMWLLLRVTLQLVIERTYGGTTGRYKEVMIWIMCHILQQAQAYDFPMDTIYIMEAKISRRHLKLSDSIATRLGHALEVTLDQSHQRITERWEIVQRQDAERSQLDMRALKSLKFEQDSVLSLHELDTYISSIDQRGSGGTHNTFVPCSNLIPMRDGQWPSLDFGVTCSPSESIANLQNFEMWVARQFQSLSVNSSPTQVCEMSYKLLKDYHGKASICYSNNPEALSIMFLTSFCLFALCDRAALRVSTLLGEYSLDLPSDLFQNLQLPSKVQMQQLLNLEQYLGSRYTPRSSRLLFDISSSDSFAVRFFRTSTSHQTLYEQILKEGQECRAAKIEEFNEKHFTFSELKNKATSLDHETHTVVIDDSCEPPELGEKHASWCEKCGIERQCEGINIDIHEWPVSSDKNEASTVVFEMAVPPFFAYWRDCRSFILLDVVNGRYPKESIRSHYMLRSNDPHLTRLFQEPASGRLGLLSVNKPAVVTHYKNKHISATSASEVCVPNGLRYHFFDSKASTFIGNLTYSGKAELACTYKTPVEPLNPFLMRPALRPDGPDPNEVIASQHRAPEHMSLEEFKDLATIPLGHHIQWLNMNLQIKCPSVDFRSADTAFVFLQCIHQAGPPSQTVHRSAHDLDNSFTASIVESIREAVSRIGTNWESTTAMSLFTAVLSRVLSLNNCVEQQCLALLLDIRNISLSWTMSLNDKADGAQSDEDRRAFIAKGVYTALVCAATLDVDDEHLRKLLGQRFNVSALIRSSVAVYEGVRAVDEGDTLLNLMRHRHTRLLNRALSIGYCNSLGLHDAMQHIWTSYEQGAQGWTQVGDSEGQWVTTQTAHMANDRAMQSRTVHLNLLDGQLLIDGFPLNHPPVSYTGKSLYSILFGQEVVKVVPASVPGFTFSTRKPFGGYSIQMGLSEADELIIQARKGSEILELLPNQLLNGLLPVHFQDDYIYWYNSTIGSVEVRPHAHPWSFDPKDSWTLAKVHNDHTWWMYSRDRNNRDKRLVGLRSPTSKAISKIFGALSCEEHIHIFLSTSSNALQVAIPSLKLRFGLIKGSDVLVSKEHSSMHVDADQKVGSLIGLASKLVLKSSDGMKRILLVPDSTLSYYCRADHVTVHVSAGQRTQVYAYTIDNLLNRLVDSGQLSSKLYLANIHALTSSCLPDPLTGKTGTESALAILKSAAVFSNQLVTLEDIRHLQNIAKLSPKREFYPQHLECMQTVHWDPHLPILSQHSGFEMAVERMIGHYRRQSVIFHAGTKFPQFESQLDRRLTERDDIRSSSFRTSGFGAEQHTAEYDATYVSRSQSSCSRRTDVAIVAQMIDTQVTRKHYPEPHLGFIWKAFVGCSDTAYGSGATITSEMLGYDADLLTTEKGHNYMISHFIALCQALSQKSTERRYSIMMFVTSLCFAKSPNIALLQVLVLFMYSKNLNMMPLPDVGSFNARNGVAPDRSIITRLIDGYIKPFKTCPEFSLPRHWDETKHDHDARKHSTWQSATNRARNSIVENVMQQWPKADLPFEICPASSASYIDTSAVMRQIAKKYQEWYHNLIVSQYFTRIEEAISALGHRKCCIPSIQLKPSAAPTSAPCYITEQSLFTGDAPFDKSNDPDLAAVLCTGNSQNPSIRDLSRLRQLIETLRQTSGKRKLVCKYAESLHCSYLALSEKPYYPQRTPNITHDVLSTYLADCQEHMDCFYSQLLDSVCTGPGKSARKIQLMPRTSTAFFLKQLVRSKWNQLSIPWKMALVHFGLLVSRFQQAKRLVTLSMRKESIRAEISNVGHMTWNPMNQPEELLVEIEGDILIRELQTRVALEMKEPKSGKNTTVQLNMGEGKSSLLVPIIAISIANKAQLPIVIVGKPQSKQMADMLRTRLGQLINRRIYFMPFSRSLQFDGNAVQTVRHMLEECITDGGVLVLQPEQILSLQHMAPENHLRGDDNVGLQLSALQSFLDHRSRYIIDECDEVFNPKLELVYSVGSQKLIDGGSSRWTLIQEVLALVPEVALSIAESLPHGIEICQDTNNSFPRIRILQEQAADSLVKRLARVVCDSGVNILPIPRQDKQTRDDIFEYLTRDRISAQTLDRVEQSSFWTESTQKHMMVLRGLLAGGVLTFALQHKRWRVQYGQTDRLPATRLAVPFNAKDCPSPSSEFSHPDVTILLTCLSMYYQGLSDDDLFRAFKSLLKTDAPDAEYAFWTKDTTTMPKHFLNIQGVNINDRPQCVSVLFPALKHSKGAIDFFLTKFIFPREMKDFRWKLTASGWDIGKEKHNATTGFSGTNDSRYLQPLAVEHFDLPESTYTNASVLDYLLQPDNIVHLIPRKDCTAHSEAEAFLESFTSLDRPAQVILDVGAQVVTETNESFASKWLARSKLGKEAVVFVDQRDVICVLDRDGCIGSLQESTFASDLSRCLVFLDEAHTRGIDLRLPIDYHAAVTLSTQVTKDRLIQACMRMRQLGQGQTVVFCVQDEIQRKIRAETSIKQIDVQSILLWTMFSTIDQLGRSLSRWAIQGKRFDKQKKLWQACDKDSKIVMTKAHAESFLEVDALTIEQRYNPRNQLSRLLGNQNETTTSETQITKRCQEFDVDVHDTTLDEELQRELAAEIEQERQMQRPRAATALPHCLHPLVKTFALTGVLRGSPREQAEAFCKASDSLRSISGASIFPVSECSKSCKLLVTQDFANTVETTENEHSDSYLRNVQWILVSYVGGSNAVQDALIISPFEANLLRHDMKVSRKTSLHMFKARCNFSHPSLDNLDFCVVSGRSESPIIPRGLAIAIAFFAGQLWFPSFAHYKDSSALLGLATESTLGEVDADGFILRDELGRYGGASGLTRSPVSFLRSFMSSVRRNGEDISKTHVGRMLQGQLLQEAIDFNDQVL